MAATTSGNPTLTRDEIERMLIQPLQQASTFLRVGSPQFTSNGEAVKIPSLTSMGSASYVAEGSAVPDVTPTTSEIELLGSDIYSLKTIVKLSSELVARSFVDVEAQFAQKLVTDTAWAVDRALWQGSTATTGSPTGLFSMTGFVNAGTVAGTAISSGDLIDMTTSYLSAYADESSAVWAISPTNLGRVRKLTDDYGQRILQPSLADGRPNTILGYPYVVTAHVPDSAIALYDKNQIAVGYDRSRASVRILDQTFAANDLIGVMVQSRFDVKPMNAGAIVKKTIS